MMNKIIFNLNDYGLDEKSFMVLLNRYIMLEIRVNGYFIDWNYIIDKGIVELTAELKKE